jgi:hypothetical protein
MEIWNDGASHCLFLNNLAFYRTNFIFYLIENFVVNYRNLFPIRGVCLSHPNKVAWKYGMI